MRVLATIGALGLGLAACSGSGSADLGDCPAGSQTQQAQGRQIAQSVCLRCHSFNLDALSRTQAQDMYSKVEAGEMPPSGALSDTEVEDMRVFLACNSR